VTPRSSKDDKANVPGTKHFLGNETGAGTASQVAADDPHKVEKLTKAGRDLDPDEGTE
jgi:hypothetical protein